MLITQVHKVENVKKTKTSLTNHKYSNILLINFTIYNHEYTCFTNLHPVVEA